MAQRVCKKGKNLTEEEVKKILQEALNSEDGLQIRVGKIRSNQVNQTLTLRGGTITSVKLEEDMLGFNVDGSRTYLTREPGCIERFVSWFEKVKKLGYKHETCRCGPGGSPVLDCPYG